jgi:CheY-like chemotaxis protein
MLRRITMAHRKAADATILIIDDDVGSRKALAEVLTDEGYSVATASDGGDGLTYLREGHRPKVILLDLMMPGLDGWDFRAEQKRDAALRAIPVIAISAAGKLMDADHTLRKPINIDVLLDLLRSVLETAVN